MWAATLLALCALPSVGCDPSAWLGLAPTSPPRSARTVSPEDDAPPEARRVVYVVVDTLKASGLGAWGYEQPVSPNLDAIAAEGVLFERAYSASPWTAPSFGTLFTGQPPLVHEAGIRSRSAPKVGGLRMRALRADVPTLPELLGEGVTSGAILNNSLLHPTMGYGRGFDTYDHQDAFGSRYRNAQTVTADALQWVDTHGDGDFLLVVHYFDPHIGYEAPEPFRTRFATGEPGRVDIPFWRQNKQIRKGTFGATPEEQAYVRGLYDGEVAYTDHAIGTLVEGLEQRGILDTAWLVVTSDHGEEHWEHGGFEHGHRYEDEVTRVPLLLRAPGGSWGAGTRVKAPVSHQDIVPTVLDGFGLEVPDHLPGKSLIPLARTPEDPLQPVLIQDNLYGRSRIAIVDDGFKLIRDRRGKTRAEVLYDLRADPAEQSPLPADHPMAATLRERLLDGMRAQRRVHSALEEAAQTGKADGSADPELPDETRAALEALGYLEVGEDETEDTDAEASAKGGAPPSP